jgi:hypothetical protein
MGGDPVHRHVFGGAAAVPVVDFLQFQIDVLA